MKINKTEETLPPVNEYVMGFFESIVLSAEYHICDCYYDGKYWKMLGNDRVEEIYIHPPVGWLFLPEVEL